MEEEPFVTVELSKRNHGNGGCYIIYILLCATFLCFVLEFLDALDEDKETWRVLEVFYRCNKIDSFVFVRITTHLTRGRNNRSENDRAINGIIK